MPTNSPWAESKIIGILSTSKKHLNRPQISEILGYANSYTRFQTFLDILPRLKSEDYWYALRNAYDSSDDLYHLRKEVRKAFLRRFKNRFSLMSAKEIQKLNSLPKKFKIYRGMTELEFRSHEYGVSWTFIKARGIYFRDKYTRNHATQHLQKVLAVATVNKKDIIAIFTERKESEVIILKGINAPEIEHSKYKWIKEQILP